MTSGSSLCGDQDCVDYVVGELFAFSCVALQLRTLYTYQWFHLVGHGLRHGAERHCLYKIVEARVFVHQSWSHKIPQDALDTPIFYHGLYVSIHIWVINSYFHTRRTIQWRGIHSPTTSTHPGTSSPSRF